MGISNLINASWHTPIICSALRAADRIIKPIPPHLQIDFHFKFLRILFAFHNDGNNDEKTPQEPLDVAKS